MGRGGASDDGPGDRQRRRPAPALLPARMAVSRGIWLAAATAALTIATVLSVTLAGGGGGAGARALTDAWGGAENALASAWGGGEKRANGTKWRDTLTAGFSQWHGTRKGAVSLLNGTADANETVAVVDEIPVDAGKTRAVHKNPKDTTWQQFVVEQPAGRASDELWEGSLRPEQLPPKAGEAKARELQDQIWHDFNTYRGDTSGISLEAIEQLYCGLGDTSLRIQIVGGKAYVVGEAASRQQGRHHRIKLQIQEMLEKYKPGDDNMPRLPNADVVIWTGNSYPPDAPSADGKAACGAQWGPLLTPGRRLAGQNTFTVLVPDDSFAGIPDAGIRPWKDEQPHIRREADAHPWQTRRPVLLFRGARSTPSRLALFESDALAESNLTDFSFTDVDEELDGAEGDVRTVFGGDTEGFLKPPQQCDARYILHMQGSAHSGRLKYAMACGAVVIWPRHEVKGREEFFHHLLMDGVNVVMTPPVTAGNGGAHLLEVVAKLEADEKHTKRIGRRAGGLIQHRLRQDDVLDHWYTVFKQQSELQKWEIKEPHADALPLEQSLQRGEAFGELPIDVTEARNCTVCEAFGLGVPGAPAERRAAARAERRAAAAARAKAASNAKAAADKRRAVEEKAEAEKKKAEEKAEAEKRTAEEKQKEEEKAKEEAQRKEEAKKKEEQEKNKSDEEEKKAEEKVKEEKAKKDKDGKEEDDLNELKEDGEQRRRLRRQQLQRMLLRSP